MMKKIEVKEKSLHYVRLEKSAQEKTIDSIHKAHASGKINLQPGKVFKGPDEDHLYLETTHKKTGEKHHLAIHKDGSVVDPHVLHRGAFDPKTLKEHQKQKVIQVKEDQKKEVKKSPEIKKSGLKINKPETKPEKKKVNVQEEKPQVKTETKDNSEAIKDQIVKQAKDEAGFLKADKSGKIEDYKAYIDFYKDSEFISHAKEKLKSLQEKADTIKSKRKRKDKRKKGK